MDSAAFLASLCITYLCQFQLIGNLGVDLGVERWVIVSMMLTCDASVVVGYDRRGSKLSHAPLHMKNNNNRKSDKSLKHNPQLTYAS